MNVNLLPLIGLLAICLNCAAMLQAAEDKPRWIQYKAVDGHQLRFAARFPADHARGDRRTAILFFVGGGYESGRAGFQWHALYFQKRGLVALSTEFRGIKTHGGTPVMAMKDAVSAIRWVRTHADPLGVDPEKIVLSGGSAGGHLALTPAMLDIEEKTDDENVDKRPAALVLFNPSIILSNKPEADYKRTGVDYRLRDRICPMLHVRPGLPPAVIFHGTRDKAVPYSTVVEFTQRYRQHGNKTVLHTYEEKPHAFYHIHMDSEIFVDHCLKADQFLQEMGLMAGRESPEIAREVIQLWRQSIIGPAR